MKLFFLLLLVIICFVSFFVCVCVVAAANSCCHSSKLCCCSTAFYACLHSSRWLFYFYCSAVHKRPSAIARNRHNHIMFTFVFLKHVRKRCNSHAKWNMGNIKHCNQQNGRWIYGNCVTFCVSTEKNSNRKMKQEGAHTKTLWTMLALWFFFLLLLFFFWFENLDFLCCSLSILVNAKRFFFSLHQ